MAIRTTRCLCRILIPAVLILSWQLVTRPAPLPAAVSLSSCSAGVLPADGSNDVLLYPVFLITTRKAAKSATLTLWDSEGRIVPGETRLEKEGVRFYPYHLLSPGVSYRLDATVRFAGGQSAAVKSAFSTLNAPLPKLWVEVLLGDVHEIRIWAGETLLRIMPCSGGTKKSPTIMGLYTLQNRGENFYSPRFREGARYWVRFHRQYLFHSVPRDEKGRIIREEEEKIGAPASHGCIRLLDRDAEWFYNTIPDGTMVIVHPTESESEKSPLDYLISRWAFSSDTVSAKAASSGM